MKKLLCAFLSLSLLFAACNKEEEIPANKHQAEKEVSLYALKYVEGPTRQGAALKYKLWEPGQTIKIKFLNGTAANQTRIQNFAAEWMEYANITFEYVTSGDADVKIGFKYGGDNVTWSYIGTDATAIAQDQPTMNFGGFISSAASTKRDVLMMFGHMLGLVNEHQSMGAEIPWDAPVVYEYYVDYEGWTEAEVNNFFFQPYSSAISNYTEYDPLSIMVWPLEDFLTTDGFGMVGNNALSEMDKEFIAQLYPSTEIPIITMTTVNQNISIYTIRGSSIRINWGDGAADQYDNGNGYHTHTYSDTNPHTIKIYGNASHIYYLSCYNSGLTELNVSKCINLQGLYCSQNLLSDIDISSNINLESLVCYDNNLTALNVRSNTNLKAVSCQLNSISVLDVTQNPLLVSLSCGANQLSSLNVSQNSLLRTLECSVNSLASLNVSNNPMLESLDCGSNLLTSLNVSNNPNLTQLMCRNNQIASLNISENPELDYLIAYHNQLSSLNISNNVKLRYIEVYDNQVSQLYWSDLSFLEYIDLRDNPLLSNQSLLVNFASSMPYYLGSGFGRFITYNQTARNWVNDILIAKNWTVR